MKIMENKTAERILFNKCGTVMIDSNEQLCVFRKHALEAMEEYANQNKRNVIVNAIAEYDKFLLDSGYTDSDVWCELPTAADTFLKEYLKNSLTNL